MSSYRQIARADVTIELFEDHDNYKAEIFSTNGVMLQPYDLSTTLIGTLYKNNIDITKTKGINYRWTKWTPTSDNLVPDEKWNSEHIGVTEVEITKEDVQDKAIFTFEAYTLASSFVYEEIHLASESISIIDVNDLLVSTERPENPYQGQLWIDDKTEPATIYMWNNYSWIVAGSVEAMVKNLLRDTASYNTNFWQIVGSTKNSFTPITTSYLGKRFIRLCSEVLVDEERGIEQTTTDNIVPNSKYSLQLLCYSKTNVETYSNDFIVTVDSIDKDGKEAQLVYSDETAETNVKQLFYTFESLSDTVAFKVKIVGTNKKRFNFHIAELALYNTGTLYPWTPNPLDALGAMDRETLFNALTNNGTIDSLYCEINPETGQPQYYFNATYIGAGKVAAKYLDVYNLKVKRKDNPDITTLEITDNGEVNLAVNRLTIQATGQSIEDYISDLIPEISNSSNTLDAMLNQLDKDEKIVKFCYDQLINNDSFKEIEFKGELSDWFDEEDIPASEITKLFQILNALNYYYTKSLRELRDIITEAKKDYSPNVNDLREKYDDYITKLANINKLFFSCQQYMSEDALETSNKAWTETQTQLGKITTTVGNLTETVSTNSENLANIQKDVNDVKQEMTPAAISTKVEHAVVNNNTVREHIESVSKQTAESFTQSVKDDVNGKLTTMQQTIDGIKEEITSSDEITGKFNTLFERTSKGLYVQVDGEGKQTLIDVNNNEVEIKSNNLNIHGIVTANENFKIEEDGSMKAKNGEFSGHLYGVTLNVNNNTTIDEDGNLAAKNANIEGKITATEGSFIGKDALSTEVQGTLDTVDDWSIEAKDGTTVIDGGYIGTHTIAANKLAVGDFTNFCRINVDKLTDGNEVVELDGIRYFKFGDDSAPGWYSITLAEIEERFKVGDSFRIKFLGKSSAPLQINFVFRAIYKEDNEAERARNNLAVLSVDINETVTEYSLETQITGELDLEKELDKIIIFAETEDSDAFVYLRDITIQRMSSGELIVNGAITGDKIHANAINGKTIIGATIQNTEENPTFKVLPSGKLYSTDAEVRGNITIVSGSVADSALSHDVLKGSKDGTEALTLTSKLQADFSSLEAAFDVLQNETIINESNIASIEKYLQLIDKDKQEIDLEYSYLLDRLKGSEL